MGKGQVLQLIKKLVFVQGKSRMSSSDGVGRAGGEGERERRRKRELSPPPK
jgi:hypothetical protein